MSLKQNWATGDSFGATDLNSIAGAVNALGFNAQAAYVATSETTTTTSFTDLTTTTDTVTVTIGSSGMAVVFISAFFQHSATNGEATMGIALSGANTLAASVDRCIIYKAYIANGAGTYGAPFFYSGLTAGSTTFKLKYMNGGGAGGTATFQYRRITVIPFP